MGDDVMDHFQKKIGILTFCWADDFGGLLQGYALKEFLESNNIGKAEIIPYTTAGLRGRYWIIPYRQRNKDYSSKLGSISKKIRNKYRFLPSKLMRMNKMNSFRRTHLTKSGMSSRAVKRKKIKSYDIFVLGSDQIWNPEITCGLDPIYFGELSKREDAMVIAYAASIGKAELDKEFDHTFQKLIRNVDVISVREFSSIPYVQKQSGRKVQYMPDPVLLISRQKWEKLAKLPKEKDYLLLYYTEYNEQLIKEAISHAHTFGLSIVCLNPIEIAEDDFLIRFGIGPAEFLGYIMNASYIFTNSFHATVFSLIFKKKFRCIAHKNLGSRTNDLFIECGIDNTKNFIIDAGSNMYLDSRLQSFQDKAFLFWQENGFYFKGNISGNCKGCGACETACPDHAIFMKKETTGFVYPYIDKNKCNRCGKCYAVCPDHKKMNNCEMLEIYGCKSIRDDVLDRSTSGGLFYLLAEWMVNSGAYVYGAVLDDDHVVRHKCAKTLDEIARIQGAKYVESELGSCYEEIRGMLHDKRILFTGTPCQIAGLKAVVGEHPNLYTIDIVCNGVGSPAMFSKYIQWIGKNGEVSDFRFRDKKTGWHHSSVSYQQNGNVHLESLKKNLYTKLYFRNLISRDSCYSCQYTSFERCSDWTIGDFWGIEKCNKEFDEDTGVSLVLIHSQKGKELFEKITDGIKYFKSDQMNCLQPRLQYPVTRNYMRKRFMREFSSYEFGALLRRFDLLSRISFRIIRK